MRVFNRFVLGLLLAVVIVWRCDSTSPTKADPALSQIVVTPFSAVIEVDSTFQLTVVGLDDNGDIMPDIVYTWAVYDADDIAVTDVVSIDSTGLVTGLGHGSVFVRGSSAGIFSNDVDISVITGPSSISLVAQDVTEDNWTPFPVYAQAVAVGKTAQLQAAVLDSAGIPIEGLEITWEIENPALLSINAQGTITGLSGGSTNVKGVYDWESGHIESDSIRVYVMEEKFYSDFSSPSLVDTTNGYFATSDNVIWQMNHLLATDSTEAGPFSGKFHFVQDGGEPAIKLTDPTTAYFANRQLLIMTYGSDGYLPEYAWPDTSSANMETGKNWRVEFRMKGMDDLAPFTTAESLVIFTQYTDGPSPYYFVFAPGRNRVSVWSGAVVDFNAKVPVWGAMPEITYDTWMNVVVEVFEGTMRTEVYSGNEPSGNWDYSYTIPDFDWTQPYIPGLWIGTFLVDDFYFDNVRYFTSD